MKPLKLKSYLLMTVFLLSGILSTATAAVLSDSFNESESSIVSDDGPVTFINEENYPVPEGKELIQIMVMRHGKPLLEKKKKYTWKEAEEYIRAYDTVGVETFEATTVCIPDGVNELYCSNLGRSISTAKFIAKDSLPLISDEKFREFERQILHIPSIKMPLSFWLVTARIPWIFGSSEIESLKEARKRSNEVAKFLDESARKEKKTMLVAHGFLNRFLEKSLKKEGWQQVRNGGHDYLSVSIYTKLVDKQETPTLTSN